jgi:hypothetical protein
MRLTVDILEEFIASISLSGLVLGYSNDGTNTTLTVAKTYHARARMLLNVDGIDYPILSVVNNEAITVSGVILLPVTYTVPNPFYFHGTPMMTNANHINGADPDQKVPMIYLYEILRERDRPTDSRILRDSDLRLFFMDSANFSDWTTDDHYTNRLVGLNNLVDAFIDAAKAYKCFYTYDTDFTRINRPNWGVFFDNKGNLERIFDDELSGVELSFTLQLKSCLNTVTVPPVATIDIGGFDYPAGTSFVEVPITFDRTDQLTGNTNFGFRFSATHGEPIDFIYKGARQRFDAPPYVSALVEFAAGTEAVINEPCYIVMPENFNGMTQIFFSGPANDPLFFPSDPRFDITAFMNTLSRGGTIIDFAFDLIAGGTFQVQNLEGINYPVSSLIIRSDISGYISDLSSIFQKIPSLSTLYIWRVVGAFFDISKANLDGAIGLTRFDLQNAGLGFFYETGAFLNKPFLKTLNISGQQMSQAELDQIIIDLEANGTSAGYLSYTTGTFNPTSASYTAYLALISRGWTVIGTAPPAP